MRPTSCPALFLAWAIFAIPATGQQYSGTFTVATESGGAMTISLSESRTGAVTGRMSGDGIDFRLDGRIEDGAVVGTMTGPVGSFPFEAERWENELWVVLYGTDDMGRPDYDDYQEIGFYVPGTEPVAPDLPIDPMSPGANPLAARGGAQGGGNPLAGGATDPYVGTFTDGSVTLQLQGVAGEYRGQVTVGGQVYPVSASGGPSGLQGVIQATDGAYAMAVQAIDGWLYVVSGGQQYQLYPSGMGGQGGYGQPGLPSGAYGLPGGRGSHGRLGGSGYAPPGGRPGFGQPGSRGSGSPGGFGATGRAPAAGFSESRPEVSEWMRLLSGRKVARVRSYTSAGGGGPLWRADVHLCSDRTFTMRDEGAPGAAAGRSGAAWSDQGSWYVVSDGSVVVLVLESLNGPPLELRMEYLNGETYANGDRVLISPAGLCR